MQRRWQVSSSNEPRAADAQHRRYPRAAAGSEASLRLGAPVGAAASAVDQDSPARPGEAITLTCREVLKMLLAGLPGHAEARTLGRPGRCKKLSPATEQHHLLQFGIVAVHGGRRVRKDAEGVGDLQRGQELHLCLGRSHEGAGFGLRRVTPPPRARWMGRLRRGGRCLLPALAPRPPRAARWKRSPSAHRTARGFPPLPAGSARLLAHSGAASIYRIPPAAARPGPDVHGHIWEAGSPYLEASRRTPPGVSAWHRGKPGGGGPTRP